MYNSNCNKLENLDLVKKLYFVVYENFLGLEEWTNFWESGPDLRILLELNLVLLKWIIGSHERVIVAGWTNFSAWF